MDPEQGAAHGGSPRRIDAVFEVLREGVSLAEVVRDGNGAVIDYWIREANPAFLRSLGGSSALGKRMRELRPDVSDRWYARFHSILASGQPFRFEYEDKVAGRWYDVHMTPLSKDELVQLYVDVTHRKQIEAHLAQLFNELNHRVKNNLMMVSGILGMQARASHEPQVKYELQQAIDRIQTISEVHTILYQSGAVEIVDLDVYLAELCKRIGSASTDRRIDIDVSAEPLKVLSEDAVQMGIVVNELITNAVKHAYPAPAPGKIEVALSGVEEGMSLSVRDYGPGLPGEEPRHTGLGMRLVTSIVQKNGGSLEMDSQDGLQVKVTLPLRKRTSASPQTPA